MGPISKFLSKPNYAAAVLSLFRKRPTLALALALH